MFYCNQCKKEVLIEAITYSKDLEEELERFHQQADAAGKLVLFNPSPIEPYRCPVCGTKLISKDAK